MSWYPYSYNIILLFPLCPLKYQQIEYVKIISANMATAINNISFIQKFPYLLLVIYFSIYFIVTFFS